MRIRFFPLIAIGSICGACLLIAGRLEANDAPDSETASRDADREAILKSARDFTTAFEKGDAKAAAALWTDQGEYESDDGTLLRGRAAIEAAFAAHFKDRPAEKMEIKVESVRFPSRDTALEEGLTCTTASDMLPDSARYRVLHVREGGKWRVALCREWAASQNRLADLDWLIGSWRGRANDRDLVISFAREKNLPLLVGEFTTTAAGKTEPLGTMRIGIDPVSGQFMSWHFDPDGGHGHGTWLREGKHWAVDSRGVQGDGAETAAVNVLTRFGADELGWRSLDRMVGGRALPDSSPIRLKRVAVSK